MADPAKLPARLRALATSLRVHDDGAAEADLLEQAADTLASAGGLAFREYARAALDVANGLLATPTAGADALRWMRSARDAVEIARLGDEPMPEDERGAIAAVVTGLREQLGQAAQDRDRLAGFAARLASEFESAKTPTADRVAGRIRRELAAVFPDGVPGHTEQEDDPDA